jgi:hypothetical protein
MGLLEKAFAQTTNDVGNLNVAFWGGSGDWRELVVRIITWILILAAVIAFFYLIYAGFTYLTAGGNPDAAKKGQQGIINAVIGIIIIFLAFAIIRAVVSFTGTEGGTGSTGAICTNDTDCQSGRCNNPTGRADAGTCK